MEIIIQREQYSDQTLTVFERMGEDRLNVLQVAIAGHAQEGQLPSAIRLIDDMVTKHEASEDVALARIGYATIADALSEVAASKTATKALLKGKMSIGRAIDAHRLRAAEAAKVADGALLRELGIAGTATLYVDEPTDLHLVHLSTVEHYQYEGVSLVNCLSNPATAGAYLARGALLYSLREGGTEPRVAIEVSPEQLAVTQARRKHDEPLHEDSSEYGALRRALAPLAAHVALIAPPKLTVTDSVIRRRLIR
jgi:hypothetical protein